MKDATVANLPIKIHMDGGDKMACPSCGGSLASVKDSRLASFQDTGVRFIRRKRECQSCGEWEFTLEITETFFGETMTAQGATLAREQFRRAVMQAILEVE